jgi:alpha-tubulin suppressor-like RCC1 family protein
MTTKISGNQITDYTIDTAQLSNTVIAAFATSAEVANFASFIGPKITTINVANSAFDIIDDTSVNVGGGYIVITGNNFVSGASVLVGNTPATAVTRISSTILQVQVPAKTARTDHVYVVNPDGGTGIKVNGLKYSSFPGFNTSEHLIDQLTNSSFGLSISASSDSSVTSYSNTTALPAGTTLLANGWFYGTFSANEIIDSDYSFTVKATDSESQDTSKAFNISFFTPRNLYTWGSAVPELFQTSDDWREIDSSYDGTFRMALKVNGTLWAWGASDRGNLGLNDRVNRSSPVQIGTGTDWKSVSAGTLVTMATKYDGTLWSWGQNSDGELGLNDRVNRSSPVQIGLDTDWSEVVAGAGSGSNTGLAHILARKTNGTIWSWGNNAVGALGHGDSTNRSSPTQIGTNTNWLKITCNYKMSAAIKTDGTLWTWGLGSGALMRNTGVPNLLSPAQVGALTSWANMLSNGDTVMFAVRTDGTLWGAGNSTRGALGNNTFSPPKSSPIQIGTDTNWSQTKRIRGALNGSAIASKTDGTVYVWGPNTGDNSGVNRSSPVQIGSNFNWRYYDHGYGLVSSFPIWTSSNTLSTITKNQAFNGQFVALGANTYSLTAGSTLPDGMTISANGYYSGNNTTATFSTTYNFTVTATTPHGTTANSIMSLRITVPAALYAWGRNASSMLGLGDSVNRSSPVQLGTGTDWNSVSTGSAIGAAIKNNGTLWLWGNNAYGMLLNPATTYTVSSPVQLGALTNWSSVSIAQSNMLATKTDGTLWAAGSNLYGHLGNNSILARSSPVQIGTGTTWKLVEANSNYLSTAAIKTDGTLWTWGNNDVGILGANLTAAAASPARRSSPVQVGALTNWNSISLGATALATKTDGTLWAWGDNSRGQLAIADGNPRSSPIQIGALTNWSMARTAANMCAGIKTDGTLWVWGYNLVGQLGLNTSGGSITSPVQLGTDTNWRTIEIDSSCWAAVKTNGTLWVNGDGRFGNLGLNEGIYRSSPVQVGTDTWISAVPTRSGSLGTIALKSV